MCAGDAMGITGGSLTASGGTATNTLADLVVNQFNTQTPFSIASAITNSGTTAIGLTKAGPGELILTGGQHLQRADHAFPAAPCRAATRPCPRTSAWPTAATT